MGGDRSLNPEMIWRTGKGIREREREPLVKHIRKERKVDREPRMREKERRETVGGAGGVFAAVPRWATHC